MMFFIHQLIEQCQLQNMRLYATFVNIMKAFDSVSSTGLHMCYAIPKVYSYDHHAMSTFLA